MILTISYINNNPQLYKDATQFLSKYYKCKRHIGKKSGQLDKKSISGKLVYPHEWTDLKAGSGGTKSLPQ